MNSTKKPGFFSNLGSDLPASVVVFLVALPLCLGIALVSKAPLFSGIIAGIVGGIVVTLVSGSALGVSGPAAGLASIVAVAIATLGSFEAFLMAVVVGGFIQILLGFLRAGVIGYYFPMSVIKGMLSGIGVFIVWKEIPDALGYDKEVFKEIGFSWDAISPGAVIITLVSLGILILWERDFMKKSAVLKLVPGPLIAVLAGIGLNALFQSNPDWVVTGNRLVSLPESKDLTEFFSQFTFPDFSAWKNPQIWVYGGIIALVASLETLLCVEATDKLDPQKNITPTNRELIAQGVGNMVSGFIGGLPITQVIVRSSANIQSGGKTKASAFFHGVLLLACVITIPKFLNLIPLASLAAILFVVGYKLAKPAIFKTMLKNGWAQFIPFLITILGIVFANLLVGIGLGLAIAIIQILWNNYKTPYRFNRKDYKPGVPITIELSEDVSFLNKAGIMHTLDQIPNDSHVIIDGSKNRSIHLDVLEIFDDFEANAKGRNIKVELIALRDEDEENPMHNFKQFLPDDGSKEKASGFSLTEAFRT